MVAELFTVPVALVAVMVNGQLAVYAKPEIVALVAVCAVIMGLAVPETANVKVTAPALSPPDHVTLNEEAVQAEKVIPVIADGAWVITTAVLDVIPPVPSYAVLSSLITKLHDDPDIPVKMVGLVPLVENPVLDPLIVYE